MCFLGPFGFTCLIVTAFLAYAQDGVEPYPVAGPPSSAVALSVIRDKVIAPMLVNGEGPYSFILDLGIEHPVVSREIAAALKQDAASTEPAQGPNPAGTQNAESVIEVQEFRLGDAASKPGRALIMDLAPFKATLGIEIGGIFSGRELGKRVLIDFAANTISVRSLNGDAPSDSDTRSVRLRLDERGQPVVSGLIDGKHVRSFLVDTTLGSVMAMPEQALRDLGLLSDATPRLAVEPMPEGGPDQAASLSEKMQIRLKSLRVGSAEIQRPLCSILPSEESLRIGLGFLKYFRTTFDFEANLLLLEHKGAMPVVCGPVASCGLTPARFAEGYWSVWVAKDSLAAKANIRSGTRLIEVNGADLKDAPYAEVAGKLAAEEGGTLSVTFIQGSETRTTPLAVQPLL